jgi:hypothetical protein
MSHEFYIWNNFKYFLRPFVRLNCYKNADWPTENKDEIDKAIKNCLEVFVLILFITL